MTLQPVREHYTLRINGVLRLCRYTAYASVCLAPSSPLKLSDVASAGTRADVVSSAKLAAAYAMEAFHAAEHPSAYGFLQVLKQKIRLFTPLKEVNEMCP